MPTDYNTIAAEYKRSKQQPWRLHVEHYTLFSLIGDLTGKSVLDLACGEGFYSRFLKQAGAARVVGVDLSERMIELARQQETERPLGIEYIVHDARTFEPGESFDLVVAGYLLNYASTEEDLRAMCRTIAGSLKPGGRFVTVNNNPAQPCEHFANGRKYGFLKTLAGGFGEGAPITWTFDLGDGSFDITNYHLSLDTHERAFRSAGIDAVRWHAPQLAPAGEAEYGREFWNDFLEFPPVTFLECCRGRMPEERRLESAPLAGTALAEV